MNFGSIEAVAGKTAIDVLDTIRELGGLPVLAHADSSKGALRDMEGQQRIALMNSPAIAAVELNNIEKSGRFLDGTDPNFRRKLAVYRASDNRTPVTESGHSADGIAAKYSLFKMEHIDLRSLGQCFDDPDVRILPDVHAPPDLERPYPRILAVGISQGFLSGPGFSFHEGLNSIIGGKGTGKSLIVELIRFALDQPSSVSSIRDDYEGKLEAQLSAGGVVTLEVQLESSEVLAVERVYDGGQNPITVRYATSGKGVAGHIARLFPVMAYSQTEALEIAKDDTAQLQLIDSFIDHTAISQRIQDLRESLGASDLALAQALAAGAEVEARTRDVATHEEQIRQLDEVLKSERHAEIRALQPKTECLEEMATHVEEIRGAYDGLVEAVEDCEPPALNEALKTESALKDLHKEVSGLGRGILKSARSLGTQVDALSAKVEKARREWKKHVDAKNEEYRRWLAQQGGDRAKLEQKRKGLAEAKEKASKALKAAKTRAAALRGLQTTRTVMLSDLSAAENALYELRRQKYAEISGSSKGRLQLQIERNGSRGQYHQALSALKKGTNLHDSTIAQVVAQVDPRVLVGYVLEEDGNGLAAAAGIAEKQGQKLVTYLHALEDFAEVLRFEHEPLLRDTPQILYRKDDGQDYDLAQLSVGQKFTALLIIALVEGNRRIIIDQPEDALDIPSVYEDLTLQLRAKKSNRQFILTTHSPAVAVAGDWDQFHVLKATARSATVAVQGAMDRPVVCLEVMQHLEGGAEPFALKTKKYALRDGKS